MQYTIRRTTTSTALTVRSNIPTLKSTGAAKRAKTENHAPGLDISVFPLHVVSFPHHFPILTLVYCRRRKIRCLPPVGEGDRCQNCARQQRECVVQPIAGSTRKGGRNQGNALSTDPMPYAEALSMTRQNNSLAHRRASKPERYEHGYFAVPGAITVPSGYYLSSPSSGVPLSAPIHGGAPPYFSQGHGGDPAGFGGDMRRPPMKQMQSAPANLYTVHHPGFDRSQSSQDSFPGSWQQGSNIPHYGGMQSAESFHPAGDMSPDASNPFWKLSLTSPMTPSADVALPSARTIQNQWGPNSNANYTYERPNMSILPPPNNATVSESFQSQQYSPHMVVPSVGFQHGSSPSQSHEEHCETNHWSRSNTSGYRSGGSI
jgi:hypothetical protein